MGQAVSQRLHPTQSCQNGSVRDRKLKRIPARCACVLIVEVGDRIRLKVGTKYFFLRGRSLARIGCWPFFAALDQVVELLGLQVRVCLSYNY